MGQNTLVTMTRSAWRHLCQRPRFRGWKMILSTTTSIRQDPLDLSFWSFLTFLHHGIDKVERHLLWKFHKLVKCATEVALRFLYKVVHKIGRLRKFNRSREIDFNFIMAWTIFMTLGTIVHHVHGYKILPQSFSFLPRNLVMVFQSRKNGVKSSINFKRSKLSP